MYKVSVNILPPFVPFNRLRCGYSDIHIEDCEILVSLCFYYFLSGLLAMQTVCTLTHLALAQLNVWGQFRVDKSISVQP